MRSLAFLIAVVCLAALASSAAAQSPTPQTPATSLPAVDRSAIDISAIPPDRGEGASDGALREAIALEQLGAQPSTETIRNDQALVEVVSESGEVSEEIVALDEIADLEASPEVRYVRSPLRASVPSDVSTQIFIGDEIAETNADDWHDAGYFGAGVKVGIIDFFDADLWDEAQDEGEVPEPAGTFCSLFSTPCGVFDPGLGDAHGIAVSEIVHEMAPEAEIYIAFAWTTADTQAAVDYFASQGVDIISRSLTATYDGPGDGTGPLAEVVDSAVAQGMVWVNSAGNSSSSDPDSGGSYWRGSWNDVDADGFMDFTSGDETLGFLCGFLNGLRWSDWGPDATDYDVYIFDTPADVVSFDYEYTSVNDQTSGFDPLEIIDDGPPCSGGSDVDYLAIYLWDEGNGTAGDVIELMGNQTTFEYSQNPYSSTGPAADSASPGMMAAGAMSGTGPAIASYSSQGPTNDERIKPDLAASSCVDSFAYQPGCFAGTSAAAPGVAGATALVIGAGLADDPVSARSWLLANATVDRGPAGDDNIYGAGELFLPSAPPDADLDARTDSGDNCPNWHNPDQSLPAWSVVLGGTDPDCDGFSTAIELVIGTDPLIACAQPGGSPDAWPVDTNLDGVINITDVLALKVVFGQSVPPGPARMDLNASGAINITDVLAHKPFFGYSC